METNRVFKWSTEKPALVIFQLLQDGILCVLFFYYVRNVEEQVDCYATKDLYSPVDEDFVGSTNVSLNFRVLMYFYISVLMLDFLNYSFCFLDLLTQVLAKSRSFRFLLFLFTNLLFCGAFLALHVLRLMHEGRVCSGDYLSKDTDLESSEIKYFYLI